MLDDTSIGGPHPRPLSHSEWARGTNTSGSGLLGELVEEGVFAIVSGPDRKIVAQGDAALGGFPKKLCIGMFCEFVEADVAAINSHGVRIGGKGDDARAVVEFDVTDFDFFSGRSGTAFGIEQVDFEVIFAVRDDGASVVEKFGGGVGRMDVLESAGIVFGDEEIIAVGATQAFAHVFEGVAVGPADADGFFGESKDRFLLGVEVIFTEDPGDLMGHEVLGQPGVGVDFDGGEDGAAFSGELGS